jgi:AcrR family transcriptional regulator
MSDASGTGLPGSIEAAWGLRPAPTKGPRRGLSLDRIVAAAVAVAAADGLGAVSMSRVAAELGTSAMTLYRYLASKDELLALMADAAIGPPPPLPADARGWRAGMAHWARAMLARYRDNPWVVRIPIGGPPTTPNNVAWMEQALTCLDGTGLHPAEKMSVLLLVSGYVRNDATLGADLYAAFEAAATDPDAVMLDYGRTLRKLLDADRFPALTKVLDAGVFDQADHPDTEFNFGLERVLDGIDALVRSRA